MTEAEAVIVKNLNFGVFVQNEKLYSVNINFRTNLNKKSNSIIDNTIVNRNRLSMEFNALSKQLQKHGIKIKVNNSISAKIKNFFMLKRVSTKQCF